MKKVANGLKYIYLTVLLLIILFPLIYILASSFKTNMELMASPGKIFPEKFTFNNYKEVWNSDSFPVFQMLFNSVWFTVGSVCISIALSAMGGFVFARGNFPGKKLMFAVITALMFVNLGSITMYPNFKLMDWLHIPKSLVTLLFIRCFGIPTANIYLVRGFLAGIPKELDEAASIDGCSFFGTFRHIILPLLTPILATVAMLSFNGSWNEYLNPMIWTMTRPEQRTLIVGIMQLKSTGEAAANWNLMLAGTVVALAPVLIAYAFCNKFFVRGIVSGAVKG